MDEYLLPMFRATSVSLLVLFAASVASSCVREAKEPEHAATNDEAKVDFELYDPYPGAEDQELRAGTLVKRPPNPGIEKFFRTVERGGGTAVLQFARPTDERLLSVMIPVAPDEVVEEPGGVVQADVDVGPIKVRLTNRKSGGAPYELVVQTENRKLSEFFLVKHYLRTTAPGSPHRVKVRLHSVSAVDARRIESGPVATIEMRTPKTLDAIDASDCDAVAWALASEVPAMAVSFPPLAGCSIDECVAVKAAWIRATHDVWRILQMLEYLATRNESERAAMWALPAAFADGSPAGEDTQLTRYFGNYADYRFEAIRRVVQDLWADIHDHQLGLLGWGLDIECNPQAAVCTRSSPPLAYHKVRSNIKVCGGFFNSSGGRQALTMVHEPLHHMTVDWQNGLLPRRSLLKDYHFHRHGHTCIQEPQVLKGYDIPSVVHLASYVADDGGHCGHRDLAFMNNDTYAYASQLIGSKARRGAIASWPYLVDATLSGQPCAGSSTPNPGSAWADPLNLCFADNGGVTCESDPSLEQLNVAVDCPE